MTDFQDIKVYKFGFIFNGVTFCWFNKNLYRMPYQKELRFYEKRKLKMQKVGNSVITSYSIHYTKLYDCLNLSRQKINN